MSRIKSSLKVCKLIDRHFIPEVHRCFRFRNETVYVKYLFVDFSALVTHYSIDISNEQKHLMTNLRSTYTFM